MSNSESIIKEFKSLLEDIQDDVLKAKNAESSFFQRIFSSSNTEVLSKAQSNIAKAINKLADFNGSESQLVAKLQSHLNERDQKIKDCEGQIAELQSEKEVLKEKLDFSDKQLNKKEEAPVEVVQTELKSNESSELDVLKQKIENLQEGREEINRKYQASQEELKDAENISVELSKRLNKLKSELLAV